MISSVAGTVSYLSMTEAVIDVGGVGFSVRATPNTLSGLSLGEVGSLHTNLVVREDSLTLFGFADRDERGIFDVLLSVSGIGPRLALAVLAVLTPEDIRRATAQADSKPFTKVPGIGPKVASRIILELAGKLDAPVADESPATAPAAQWESDVVAAMTTLGWTEKDARASVERTIKAQPELTLTPNVPEILRATLRSLGQEGARRG